MHARTIARRAATVVTAVGLAAVSTVTAGSVAVADQTFTCSAKSPSGFVVKASFTRINYGGGRSAIKATTYRQQKVYPLSNDEIWSPTTYTGTGLQTRSNTSGANPFVTQWGNSSNALDMSTRTVKVAMKGSGRAGGILYIACAVGY